MLTLARQSHSGMIPPIEKSHGNEVVTDVVPNQETTQNGDPVYENQTSGPEPDLPPDSHLQSFWGQLWQESLQSQCGSEPEPGLGCALPLWSVSKHDGFDLSTSSGHRIRFGTVFLNG